MTLLQRKCPLTIWQEIPVVWLAGRQVPTTDPLLTAGGMPKYKLGKILETMQSLQWPSTGRETVDLWDAAGLLRSQWVLAFSSISDCYPASLGVHYCLLPRGDSWIPSTATIFFCDASAMTFIHEKQSTNGETRVELCQKCDVNSYKDVAALLQSHFPPGKDQSNRHCKHSRDHIWYFVKLIAYT